MMKNRSIRRRFVVMLCCLTYELLESTSGEITALASARRIKYRVRIFQRREIFDGLYTVAREADRITDQLSDVNKSRVRRF